MTRTTITRCSNRERSRRLPTPTELATLTAMLEQQRAFRLEQLAELDRPARGSVLTSTDPEVARSLAAGAHAALHEVEAALARMGAGTFGRCTSCDRPLERERLEILPQTAWCLPCVRAGRQPVAC